MAKKRLPAIGYDINDYAAINPLITDSGHSGKVRHVLDLLSGVVTDFDAQLGYPLTAGKAEGLSLILETCRLALMHMDAGVPGGDHE